MGKFNVLIIMLHILFKSLTETYFYLEIATS